MTDLEFSRENIHGFISKSIPEHIVLFAQIYYIGTISTYIDPAVWGCVDVYDLHYIWCDDYTMLGFKGSTLNINVKGFIEYKFQLSPHPLC